MRPQHLSIAIASGRRNYAAYEIEEGIPVSELDNHPRDIDIERFFETLVPTFRGGRIIRELIPDAPSMRPNADYYFPNDDVIAELKCFEVALDDEERLRERFLTACQEMGYAPAEALAIALRQRPLPQDVARRIVEKSLSHVRKAIEKANRQIAATKEQLGRPNALGIVILANDNNRFATPFQQFHMLFERLRNLRDSHIDSLIYITPNYYYRTDGSDQASSLWISAYKRPILTLTEFVDDFGAAWTAYRLAQDKVLQFAVRTHEPLPKMFDVYPERHG